MKTLMNQELRSIQCRGADGRCRQYAYKLVGKVTEVCQAKGCWMNVVADNGQRAHLCTI
ncbi:MAG: DUF4920 domain-containing protein [Saprospiraceae bacterium]|nr:DUF4920 domain-containing protein [Saprospiraceae bacterium]